MGLVMVYEIGQAQTVFPSTWEMIILDRPTADFPTELLLLLEIELTYRAL